MVEVEGTLLTTQEYQVKIAANGMRALEIIQKPPLPDLVLLDINLPDIDGYEVCRRIKENPVTSETSIIFVTAESTQDSEAYGLQLGAADYITAGGTINYDDITDDINTLITQIGTAGAGLTDLGGMSTGMKAGILNT